MFIRQIKAGLISELRPYIVNGFRVSETHLPGADQKKRARKIVYPRSRAVLSFGKTALGGAGRKNFYSKEISALINALSLSDNGIY